MSNEVNYGPLSNLIGLWKGDKGIDIAPEPDGQEENPYYETIEYVAVGDVKNAESQVLAVIRYHQIVKRKSNNEIFHDETGYWMWDASAKVIMHSLTIPRSVCLLAGGTYKNKTADNKEVVIEVAASLEDKDWNIIQSPFMMKKARTTSFFHRITIGNGKMAYKEITTLDIYGKVFEHTDENELTRL